ncbi:unnamed protein product [Arabidopsis thaliana]|uniref:(thale cress) hypothetical protein n=2 Tax=Arabidopsis thaliana TaxID=3702 RepID=A0A7G2DX16_ARATH|nr:unnamed protein product [Arabidopsis thaliana]
MFDYTNQEDKPKKESAHVRAMVEASVDGVWKELYSLFPPKVGESSTDQPKEGYTERDDELLVKRLCDFMKGDAHSNYYKPVITLAESSMEQLAKDFIEVVISEKEQPARDD